MKPRCASRSRRAFSYVEMLVSVAVIGILCGIAVTALSHPQRQAMVEATRQQNAASIASMSVCLEVAGCSAVLPDNVEGTIRQLIKGITPSDGPLKGRRFVVSGVADEDVPAIARYLSIDGGELVYHSEPTP